MTGDLNTGDSPGCRNELALLRTCPVCTSFQHREREKDFTGNCESLLNQNHYTESDMDEMLEITIKS